MSQSEMLRFSKFQLPPLDFGPRVFISPLRGLFLAFMFIIASRVETLLRAASRLPCFISLRDLFRKLDFA